MTNDIDRDTFRKAREWAEYLTARRDLYGGKATEARAAAAVILAAAAVILALPEPPRPTLAELNAAENNAPTDYLRCAFENIVTGQTGWIVGFHPDGDPQLLTVDGDVTHRPAAHITPRPDWRALHLIDPADTIVDARIHCNECECDNS